MSRPSLRTGLIASVLAVTAALMLLAGVALYLLAQRYLIAEFDRELARKLQLLVSTVHLEYQVLELEFEELDLGEFVSAEAGGYFQLWIEGRTLYRSPSLGPSDLPIEWAEPLPGTARPIALPGGVTGRGFVVRYAPRVVAELDPQPSPSVRVPDAESLEVTLAVARDARPIQTALRALRWGLLGVAASLMAALAVVIRAVIRRGLRPVDDLTRRLDAMQGDSLADLKVQPDLPREMVPVVERFNGVLTRLREAFEREQRFSADVAHELRTPLAALRSSLEVTRSRPRTPEHYIRRLDELHAVTTQMQAMVERLFTLATLERAPACGAGSTADLDALVGEAWRESLATHPRADACRPHLELRVGDTVRADATLLGLVVRNLLDNALSYVDPGGEVSITTRQDAGLTILTVRNSGSQVSASEASRVFDRFWRADAARADTGTHAGLGLSLAQLAARGMGATLEARSQAGGDFIVTLTLPGPVV